MPAYRRKVGVHSAGWLPQAAIQPVLFSYEQESSCNIRESCKYTVASECAHGTPAEQVTVYLSQVGDKQIGFMEVKIPSK